MRRNNIKNRTSGDRLWDTVMAGSVSDDRQTAVREWHVTRAMRGECFSSIPMTCVCGHHPVYGGFELTNVLNGNVIPLVGIGCLRRLGCPELIEETKGLDTLVHLSSKARSLRDGREFPIRDEEDLFLDGTTPLTPKAVRALLDTPALEPGRMDPHPEIDSHEAADVILRAKRGAQPDKAALALAHELFESRARPWLEAWDGRPLA